MIYTLTRNPALDRTLWIERLQPDDSNQIKQEQRFSGGKRNRCIQDINDFEDCQIVFSQVSGSRSIYGNIY